jgi:hypothetical protein
MQSHAPKATDDATTTASSARRKDTSADLRLHAANL